MRTPVLNLLDEAKRDGFNFLVFPDRRDGFAHYHHKCSIAMSEGPIDDNDAALGGMTLITAKTRQRAQSERGTWQWCPECWSRVYRPHAILTRDTEIEAAIVHSWRLHEFIADWEFYSAMLTEEQQAEADADIEWELSHALHIICPARRVPVSTGVTVSLARWRRSRCSRETHYLDKCLECGQQHAWSGPDVVSGGALRRRAASRSEAAWLVKRRAYRRTWRAKRSA